jgi:hypothetical protein
MKTFREGFSKKAGWLKKGSISMAELGGLMELSCNERRDNK